MTCIDKKYYISIRSHNWFFLTQPVTFFFSARYIVIAYQTLSSLSCDTIIHLENFIYLLFVLCRLIECNFRTLELLYSWFLSLSSGQCFARLEVFTTDRFLWSFTSFSEFTLWLFSSGAVLSRSTL